MKKYKITLLVSVVAAIIIEALPFGAVCNFATPEKTITQTFSYFSLIPYGYANFGPFLTAVSTCILFIFAIILFTPKAKKIITAAAVISGFSLFTSVLPLIMFGGSCFNLVSVFISLLMLLQFVVIMIIKSKKEVIQSEA